eukprot:2366164-Pyramimonas_sp.AAC.1
MTWASALNCTWGVDSAHLPALGNWSPPRICRCGRIFTLWRPGFSIAEAFRSWPSSGTAGP